VSRVTSLRRLLLILAGALLLLVVLVFTYQSVRTVLALRQAKDETHQLSAEVRRNDAAGVTQTLRNIEKRSATAHANSDNFLWDGAGKLPFVGDDIASVQVMARALAEASHGATVPAGTLLAQVQGGQLRDSDGKLDLTAIGDLEAPLHQVTVALQKADTDVATIDPDHLVGPLSDAATTVQSQLHTLLSTARGGETVARLVPSMLGADGPRQYLLVVQNNAEIRSTGGLPGSLSILKADDGKLTLGDQRAVDDYQVLSSPVLPLTDEEKALYGDNLGENIRDTDITPDWPRAAELMSAMTKRSFGTDLDGVISVDPVVLSQVLKATGPVNVGGETFTSGNVVHKLLNQVYQRFSTRTKQNDYFDAVARGVFTNLITRHVEPIKVLRQLGEAASERRLLVWSSHPDEETALAPRASGGTLPRDTGNTPQVGLYLNDGTAAKIEYYLDYDSTIRSASCSPGGAQTLQVGMTLSSSAPRHGYQLSNFITGFGKYAAKGTMRVNLRMYAPTGGQITRLSANGQPIRIVTLQHDGRQVAIVTMFIRGRQQVRLSAEIHTRDGQTGNPQLKWTPGAHTRTTGTTATSAC
jgi:hypothetical protein